MTKHIPHFEVLRGTAALWVFISHVLLFVDRDFVPFSKGGQAVELFILLSGFVIGLLRINNPEPYLPYLFRRWVRLYPVFLIALAIGVATPDLYSELFGWNQWMTEPRTNVLMRAQDQRDYFWQHLLAHLTLLHGMIPDYILPQSALAFSGPLWSISIEWQFYLVAPFLMGALRGHTLRVVSVGLLMLALAFVAEKLGWMIWQAAVPSFLPLRLDLFIIGMICAALWDRARVASPLPLAFAVAVGAMVALMLAPSVLPVLMWFTTYYLAAVSGRTRVGALADRVFNLSIARWLGRISYGVYLLHLPVLLGIASIVVIPFAGDWSVWPATLLLGVLSLPLTLLAASLSFRFVEKPLIAWGRNFAGRLGRPASRVACDTA
jgi:peptidoglycan/LPS O-acetylase OafA/YrhL